MSGNASEIVMETTSGLEVAASYVYDTALLCGVSSGTIFFLAGERCCEKVETFKTLSARST